MIWRATKGAFIGACLAGGAAVAAILLLFGLPLLLSDIHPLDRPGDVERFRWLLLLAVSAGACVGAIAGFAARTPRRGMPLLTSIGVVAGCAALARLATCVATPVQWNVQPSYVPTIVSALAGGAVVLLLGLARRGNAEAGSR